MTPDGGEGFLVRGDRGAVFPAQARAAAAPVRSAAAALARTSWVAVSQAQASEMTSRGDPDRRTGPEVRFPAPVMVALSSPERGLGRAPPGQVRVPDRVRRGGLVVQQGGDHGGAPRSAV